MVDKEPNMTVGNYEPKNFDLYPEATAAFAESLAAGTDVIKLEHAAKHVDVAFGILKKAVMVGILHVSEYDEFAHRIDEAETILDEVDEIHNHYYLRDHIEAMAVEMLDLSDVDIDDDTSDYSDEDEWLFGVPETAAQEE